MSFTLLINTARKQTKVRKLWYYGMQRLVNIGVYNSFSDISVEKQKIPHGLIFSTFMVSYSSCHISFKFHYRNDDEFIINANIVNTNPM